MSTIQKNALAGISAMTLVAGLLIIVWAMMGSSTAVGENAAPAKTGFTLTSSAFKDGGDLPVEFTGDGDSIQPPLAWDNLPAGTKSIAIVMHHTPGPGDLKVYMLIYNIPADAKGLKQGSNNVGTYGANTVNNRSVYAPPHSKGPGKKLYTITAYALSSELKFEAPNKVTFDQLAAAVKDKTLATADLNVNYDRTNIINAGGQSGPKGPGNDRNAQPNDRQPPQDQQGGPGGRRGPGGPPEQRALQNLALDDVQAKKVEAAMTDFRDKKQKLEAELLAQMKTILTPEQFQQYSEDFTRRPPPPPDGGGPGDGNGPPPPPDDNGPGGPGGNEPPPPPLGQ